MLPEVQALLSKMFPFPLRMAKPAEAAASVREVAENSCLNGVLIRLDGAILRGRK